MRDDLEMSRSGAPGDPSADTHAHLRALHVHWAEARRGAAVPYRAHIDPGRIAPLLPNAFVAERIAPGVTRLRIAGMHLGELMGTEVRGMPLCSFIAPDSREAFAPGLVELFDRPRDTPHGSVQPRRAGPGKPARHACHAAAAQRLGRCLSCLGMPR